MRATVAQMTGCEAIPAMYRSGGSREALHPSGSPVRV